MPVVPFAPREDDAVITRRDFLRRWLVVLLALVFGDRVIEWLADGRVDELVDRLDPSDYVWVVTSVDRDAGVITFDGAPGDSFTFDGSIPFVRGDKAVITW